MKYKVLEHPTRGIFVEYDDIDMKPRFKWSITRDSHEVHAFYNEASIQRELSRWPDRIKSRTEVVEVDTSAKRPFRMRLSQ